MLDENIFDVYVYLEIVDCVWNTELKIERLGIKSSFQLRKIAVYICSLPDCGREIGCWRSICGKHQTFCLVLLLIPLRSLSYKTNLNIQTIISSLDGFKSPTSRSRNRKIAPNIRSRNQVSESAE